MHTHMYAYTHVFIHTYIHTYIHILRLRERERRERQREGDIGRDEREREKRERERERHRQTGRQTDRDSVPGKMYLDIGYMDIRYLVKQIQSAGQKLTKTSDKLPRSVVFLSVACSIISMYFIKSMLTFSDERWHQMKRLRMYQFHFF